MNETLNTINWSWAWPAVKALILVIVGYFIAKLATKSARKLIRAHASEHQTILLEKTVFFVVMLLFIMSALQQINFSLSVLLGSAGIVTAAVGFASKSSISNIISGIFLIIEKSFEIGDTIKVNGYTGTVKSIDILSVKIRTFDNTMVRIPNEKILGTDLTNLTHYRLRRVDIPIGISYTADVDKVKKVLLDLIADNTQVMKKPEPSVRITDFGDSAINIRFSVYAAKEDYGALKAELYEQVKLAFEREKIDIPYPQLTVHQES